jgi:hypothetical protein
MSDTTRVELPPGCVGFDMPDGSILRPDEPGGAVDMPSRYAASAGRALGLAPPMTGFSETSIPSAVCGHCGFRRFAWIDRPDICPRCGAEAPLEIAS